VSDPLETYLQDHLAGAMHAIELLESIRDEYGSEPVGKFAGRIVVEIEADRGVLRALTERVAAGSDSITAKEAIAWLSEKVSRLKLRRGGKNGLGLFESLEFLSLGIEGKLALWRALAEIAPNDSRLLGMDFEDLCGRARSQRAMTEEWRLEAARTALGAKVDPSGTIPAMPTLEGAAS
jgi:hypothetical protein